MMDEHHVPGQSGWLALAGRGDESTGGVSSSVRGSPQRERAVGEVHSVDPGLCYSPVLLAGPGQVPLPFVGLTEDQRHPKQWQILQR